MSYKPPTIHFERHTPAGGRTTVRFNIEKVAAGLGLASGVIAAVVSAIVSIKDSSRTKTEPLPTWFITVVVIAGVTTVLAAVTAVIVRERRRAAIKRDEQERLDNAADRLRERMELPALVHFNQALLEKYHGIATRQANKSFVSSLTAMAIGLVALVAAFVASMHYNSQGERIFIGSLAALSTVFVGYISKTFLAVYDRSIQQLNQYFNQPVLNGYFLTAERITERLEGPAKDDLTAQIVLDVLETGKQMHQVNGSKQSGAPKTLPKIGQQRSEPAPQ
ncbi:TRADD-N-associated membrane domain-containing protein [Streptomyces sp. NPDC002004]